MAETTPVGALIDRAGHLAAGVQELADVQPAAGGAGSEILEQLQFLAGVNQHRRQFRRIGAVVACLHQPDRAIAAAVQIGSEFAQDLVGILVPLVDHGGEVALRVKHHAPSCLVIAA